MGLTTQGGETMTPGLKKRLVKKAKYMLFELGYSQKKTGKELGISQRTIGVWVEKYNWKDELEDIRKMPGIAKLEFADSLSAFEVWANKTHPEHTAVLTRLMTEYFKTF